MELIVKTKSNEVNDAGVVTIAVNAIGNLDSHKEISASGSFDKTLLENFKRTRHFLNHNRDILIGCPLEGNEVNKLIVMKSEMNLDIEKGRDVYSFYKLYQKNDMTLEHSVGVEKVKVDKVDPRLVLEWRMWEFSTLYDWASNPNTPLLDLKQLQFQNDPQKSISFLKDALKLKFSDTILETYENYLVMIEKAISGKEVELVTCSCGLTFDYNSVHEHTLEDEVLQIAREAINWNTYKIVQSEVEKLTPELQNQIQDILHTATLTKKSINDLTSFVRCPNCYNRIYKNQTINTIEQKSMIVKPSADTSTESRPEGTLTVKNLGGLFGIN